MSISDYWSPIGVGPLHLCKCLPRAHNSRSRECTCKDIKWGEHNTIDNLIVHRLEEIDITGITVCYHYMHSYMIRIFNSPPLRVGKKSNPQLSKSILVLIPFKWIYLKSKSIFLNFKSNPFNWIWIRYRLDPFLDYPNCILDWILT